MKPFCVITIVISLLFSINCFSQDGRLDSTFDIDGINTFFASDGSGAGGSGNSVLVQPNGKIIIGGTSGSSKFALVRYKATGKLDSTFGINGSVIKLIGFVIDESGIVGLQSDGKILIAGGCYNNTGNYSYGLARFDSSGDLDNTFGDGGQVITSFNSGSYDDPFCVVVQTDGKIIEAGSATTTTGERGFGAARFNTDGTLDNSFGTGGEVITQLGYQPFAQSVIVQPDGKILLGGYASSAVTGGTYFALLRYDANGILDNTFGTGGIATTFFGDGSSGDNDEGYAMALQSDGKILMTGLSFLDSIHQNTIPIVRYNTDGSLDNSFGKGGKVNTLLKTSVNIYGITLQQDNKIIIVGDGGNDTVRNGSLLLARYSTNGTLDSSFGTYGTVNTTVDTSGNEANAVTMQPNGKIVIAGFSAAQGMVVARYLSGLILGVLNFSSPQNPLLIYPNPIKGQATLQYTLTQSESISLSLYDMLGRQMQNFFTNQTRASGEHKEELLFANTLAAGNYILNITNGHSTQGVKVTVVR